MSQLKLLHDTSVENSSKIILLVMDGLGGLPQSAIGQTELETADTPNLDRLAAKSACGLIDPVLPGITPGSGPAHLALFGYDPLQYLVGRGVLSALGVGFQLETADVAARVNFATMDEKGNIVDRRAGRIPTAKNNQLTALLEEKIKLPGIEVYFRTEKEHRAALILRGPGLEDGLSDTDPQQTGVPPRAVTALKNAARPTADSLNDLVRQANQLLKDHHPANSLLLRGIDKYHPLPAINDQYRLHSAAIAGYPMYRGVAQLAGMQVLDTKNGVGPQLETLEKHYSDFDFFFIHIKKTDSAGEDGDFTGKVSAIEEVDRHLPRLLRLNPDVLAVTGDHSTPAVLKSHSWHPVPLLLHGKHCRPDGVRAFGERTCILGGLGRFPAKRLMPLMLANALRLNKFGA